MGRNIILTPIKKISKIYKSIKLDLFDCFTYFLLIMLAHRLSYSAVAVSNGVLKNILHIPWPVRNVCIYLIFAIVPHLIYLTIAYRVASKQYKTSDDRYLWLKTGLFYVLPGELIRLCVCSTTVNADVDLPWKFGMAFAPLSNLIFTETYGNWSGRAYEVSTTAVMAEIEYIAMDYIAYIMCHIIYLIPYLTVTMLIYYMMWKKVKKERDDMRAAVQDIGI